MPSPSLTDRARLVLETATQLPGWVPDWVPGWLPGLVVLMVLTAVALLAHVALERGLLRLIHPSRLGWRSLVGQVRWPSRFALILLILTPLVPAAGLPDAATTLLVRLLLIAFILLLGWSASIAVELASETYTRRAPKGMDDDVTLRAHLTQVRVLSRAADILIAVVTLAAALMTFSEVRQFGVSLFASAGAAGLVVGLAARPLIANLIAGIQIALTQPIRLEDAVIVEGEWGAVEEIASTYVVLRLWDLRRMIVPLTWFMEKPFQNWTHRSASLIGSVYLYVDWTVPVAALRERLQAIAKASPLWDGATVGLQVTDVTRQGLLELRVLVSARNAASAWDLRCEVRENLVAFLQQQYPHALPRVRMEPGGAPPGPPPMPPGT